MKFTCNELIVSSHEDLYQKTKILNVNGEEFHSFILKYQQLVEKIGSAASTSIHWISENTGRIGKKIGDGLPFVGDKVQDIAKRMPDGKVPDNTFQ